MKHARLRHLVYMVCFGVFMLSVCGGCGSSKIVTSGTLPPYSFSVGLTTPQSLLKSGKIDADKKLTRPDGVEIDAWAVTHDTDGDAKGTVVLLHGEGEWKLYYLDLARKLAGRGYDVVLVDLRMHGWSGGEYITCGVKESHDVKAAVDAFVADGMVVAKPITVFGVTFGGATALEYAALDPRVEGVMVMAPWASAAAKARRDLGALASEAQVQAELDKAGELADFDPADASAVDAAATLTCPVYIAHGSFDLSVPISDSEAIYVAIPHDTKRLQIIVPGTPEYLAMVDFDTWRTDRIVAVAERTFQTGRTTAGHSDAKTDTPQAEEQNAPPTTQPAK